jgi:predicted kinase
MQEQDNLVLVILSGIPCAGKSIYSEKMTEWFYATYDRAPVITISRDAIREAKFGKNYKFSIEREEEVTKEFYKQLGIASTFKRVVIILDDTHCKESYIDKYLAIFRGMHNSKKMEIYVKFLDVPLWKAYVRNVWRKLKTGKWIPFKSINTMKRNYDRINREKYKHLIPNDF